MEKGEIYEARSEEDPHVHLHRYELVSQEDVDSPIERGKKDRMWLGVDTATGEKRYFSDHTFGTLLHRV